MLFKGVLAASSLLVLVSCNAGLNPDSVSKTEGRIGALSSPVFFDSCFGVGGKVTTPFGSNVDDANGMVRQPDGKIVLAGYTYNGNDNDFAVARYNPDGSLDTSFNGSGKVTTAIGTGNEQANAVALQADGKIVLAGYTYNGSNYDFAVVRYNPGGSLDTSFNGSGKVVTAIGTNIDLAYSLAIQPDSKIVVAGATYSGTYDFAVVRYNPDGSLDTGFNGSGKAVTAIGSSHEQARDVAIQNDGKIVLGGYSSNGSNNDFALVRYNANGSLDTTFNATGKVTTGFVGTDEGRSLLLQPDGKLVLAGFTSNGTNQDFALARYNANGSLDNTFGVAGKVTTDLGSTVDQVNDITVQFDGKIVATGSYSNGGNNDFALARYTTNGSLDTDFDGDGIATFAIGSSHDFSRALLVQPDGQFVVGGGVRIGLYEDFGLVRFGLHAAGSLDTCFDDDGIVTTDFAARNDGAASIALQSDGKIVAVGGSDPGTNNSTFALARYNPNGSLDTSFGNSGKVLLDIGNGEDWARSTAIQSDGKIVVGGFSTSGSVSSFTLARFNSNGTVDTTFGNSGITITQVGTMTSAVSAIALQSDGKIVAVGFAQTNTSGIGFAVARYNSNGSLDTGFATGGTAVNLIGGLDAVANAVVLQSDGKLVVGGMQTDSKFALARYNSNGLLDTSFGSSGSVITSISAQSDAIYSLAIQSDGKIVAGGQTRNPAGQHDLALLRYTSSGSLDSSFGGSGTGWVTTDLGGDEAIRGIALQSDGKIVAGGGGNGAILARYSTNGILDTTLDGDGVVMTPIGGLSLRAGAIRIQGDGKYVLAGVAYPSTGGNGDFFLSRYYP